MLVWPLGMLNTSARADTAEVKRTAAKTSPATVLTLRRRRDQPISPTAKMPRRARVEGSGTTSAVTLSVSVCPPVHPLRSCSSERLNWYWPEKLPSCDVFTNKSMSPLVWPAGKSEKDIASVPKMPPGSEIAVTDSRARPARYVAGRFWIWNCMDCVPLPACNVPTFRFSVPLPLLNAGGRMVENSQMQDELKSHAAKDQILHVDLKGRDPDDGATQIPYEKGALFLTQLEQVFGRAKVDAFLKDYFDHFAFQSITMDQFLNHLRRHLFTSDPKAPMDPLVAQAAPKIPVNEWVFEPGLPESAPVPRSDAFAAVDEKIAVWMHGKPIDTANWSTQEWLHFPSGLPGHLDVAQMKRLDTAFHLTQSGNSEILSQWLLMAVRNHYAPADERLEGFPGHGGPAQVRETSLRGKPNPKTGQRHLRSGAAAHAS